MKILFLLSSMLLLFYVGCGGGDSNDESPPPASNASPADAAFELINPVTIKRCGGSSCHTSGSPRDQIVVSAKNFLGSRACSLVANYKMPKPGSAQAGAMTSAERGQIADFCYAYRE
jgi:hypothetical protein